MIAVLHANPTPPIASTTRPTRPLVVSSAGGRRTTNRVTNTSSVTHDHSVVTIAIALISQPNTPSRSP